MKPPARKHRRFCHILAALFGDANDMSRQQPIRLRESRAPMRVGAKVIDAQYEVIGRRTVWRRIVTLFTAIFWAAAVGFAVPQVWIFAQQVGVFFAAS